MGDRAGRRGPTAAVGVRGPAGDSGSAATRWVAGPAAARRGAMIRAVTAVLKRAGKVVAGIVPAGMVTGLGLSALGTLVFLAVLAAGVA